MKTKFIYLLILLMTPITFAAEHECAGDGGTTIGGSAVGALTTVASRLAHESCPNGHDLSKLNGLCDFVFDRTRSPSGSSYRFEYERAISEAACVSSADSDDIKRQKIQSLWNSHQESFRCTSPTFDVSRGSVLKYAISSRSFSFVNAAIGRWKLNFNYIDPSDNRTLLDYVQRELNVNRGSTNEAQLQEFFNILRSNGAKFRSELL